MKNFTTTRQTPLLSVCALAAALVGAAVFGQSPGPPTKKSPVNKPKVAVKKVTLDESHFEVLNARRPIKFQPFTLAEFQKKAGAHKLTANSDLSIPYGKTVKKVEVQTYLDSLNKVEKKVNSYGYSLRHPLPKGGVQLRLKTRTTKEALQKERDRIAKAHHKVTPEKEKLARALSAKLTKKELQARLTTAKKTHAQFEKWRKTELAKAENQLNAAPSTPEEHKLHERLLTLSQKKEITKSELHETIQEVKAMKKSRPSIKVDLSWLSNLRTDEWDWKWNWYDGSSDKAKVYVNFEVGASFMHVLTVPLVTSAWGSSQVGADVFSNSFSILDAGFFGYSSETGGTHIRAHARFLGNDIFTPISQDSASGIWEQVVDRDFPVINLQLQPFTTWVGPFEASGQMQINGDVHVKCYALFTPTTASLTPSVTTNLTVNGSVGGGVFPFQVAAEGTMTLLNEELDLQAGAWIIFRNRSRPAE
jgi:hypothetical protein